MRNKPRRTVTEQDVKGVPRLDQPGIASRIKYLCDQRYDGNRGKLAKACGCDSNIIRDLLAGRRLSEDAIEHLVKRVCLLRDVSSYWIRHGQGHPFRSSGQTIAIIPSIDPQIIVNREGLLVKPIKHAAPKPEEPETVIAKTAATTSLDLFADSILKIRELESKVENLSGRVTESEAARTRYETAAKAANGDRDSRLMQFSAACQEQGIEVMEAKRVLGRLESAIVAIRAELDKMGEELRTVQDAMTAPAALTDIKLESLKLPKPIEDEEAILDPDARVWTVDYLALVGKVPQSLRDEGLSARSVCQYVSTLAAVEGILPDGSPDDKGRVDRTKYPVRCFREFAQHFTRLKSEGKPVGRNQIIAAVMASRVNGEAGH